MSDMLDRKLLEKLLDNEDLKLESESGSYLAVGVILRIREAIQSSALSPQDNTRQQEGQGLVEALDSYIYAIEKVAFSIPPKNEYTPIIVDLCLRSRAAIASYESASTPSPPTKQEPPHDHT